MNSTVRCKVGTSAEVLPAVGALVRLLARVRSFVIGQVRAAAKAFSTLQALIRFLSCMHPDVVYNLRASTEALPAQSAFIRLLSRVGSLVGDQGGFLIEVFATV